MCTSNFELQTRRSLNPVQNVKNLTQPGVALDQAKEGFSMPKPAATAAPMPTLLVDDTPLPPRKKTYGGTLLAGG